MAGPNLPPLVLVDQKALADLTWFGDKFRKDARGFWRNVLPQCATMERQGGGIRYPDLSFGSFNGVKPGDEVNDIDQSLMAW